MEDPRQMPSTGNLFVLFDDRNVRTRHTLLLSSLGIPSLKIDIGPEPLPRMSNIRHGIAQMVLPHGIDFLILLQQICSSFPDAIVLAVGDFFTTERRIQAYMAGANNCLASQVGPEELAAVLQALHHKEGAASDTYRARQDGNSDEQASWVLSQDGWQLASAHGVRIDLRSHERTLMQWFTSHAGQELRRSETLLGTDGLAMTGRYIDVTISRLRQKARALGTSLPLKSVHGSGYVFVGGLALP